MDKFLTEGKKEDTIKGVKALVSDVGDYIKRNDTFIEVFMDKFLTEGKKEDTIKGVKALVSDVGDYIKRKRNTYEVEPEFLVDMISMMKQRGYSLNSVERDIEAEAKKLSKNLDSTFMKISTQIMKKLVDTFSVKYRLAEDEEDMSEAYTEKQKQDILDKNTVLTKLPNGWNVIKTATTAPKGYVWVSNGKSILSKDRKIALIKVEDLK